MQAEPWVTRTVAMLIGALAFLVLAACSGGADATTGSFVYHVDEGVEPHDAALIREVSADARRYYEKQLGYRLQGEVHVHVVMRDSLSKPAYAGEAATFYLTNAVWLAMNDADKKYLVAHEVFHTFQYSMAGVRLLLSAGWLVEGSADYAAFKFLDAEGDLKYAAALTSQKLYMSPSRLGQFVTFHEAEYALAFVGADYLLRERGFKPLVGFYAALQTTEWRESFKKTFGRTVDAFIDDFERARSR